jgi:hypothetical protein
MIPGYRQIFFLPGCNPGEGPGTHTCCTGGIPGVSVSPGCRCPLGCRCPMGCQCPRGVSVPWGIGVPWGVRVSRGVGVPWGVGVLGCRRGALQDALQQCRPGLYVMQVQLQTHTGLPCKHIFYLQGPQMGVYASASDTRRRAVPVAKALHPRAPSCWPWLSVTRPGGPGAALPHTSSRRVRSPSVRQGPLFGAPVPLGSPEGRAGLEPGRSGEPTFPGTREAPPAGAALRVRLERRLRGAGRGARGAGRGAGCWSSLGAHA